MPHEIQNSGGLLFSNVRVSSVAPDIASGTLTVKVIYAEREEQKLLYDEVLYSQLDKTAEGKRVALAVELAPDDYLGGKHLKSASTLMKECRLNDFSALDEMIRQGYRIFTHYVGEQDEYVVIAKRLLIE